MRMLCAIGGLLSFTALMQSSERTSVWTLFKKRKKKKVQLGALGATVKCRRGDEEHESLFAGLLTLRVKSTANIHTSSMCHCETFIRV